MSSQTSLGAAAADRKARLAALKSQSLKRKAPSDDAMSSEPPSKEVANLYLSGRNFDTATRGPKLGFETAPDELPENANTLEKQAEVLEAEAKQKQETERQEADQELDVDRLRPNKRDFDLKREYTEKTRVLEQQTSAAIQKLLRQRIEQQRKEKLAKQNGAAEKDGEVVTGFEGADLAEAVRGRELEEEEEARREAEIDEMADEEEG
jgi:coiled-coil domain-containing protein 12